jgi:hypothetical protein
MTKTYFQVLYDNGNGWPCGLTDGICDTREEAVALLTIKARQSPLKLYIGTLEIEETEVSDANVHSA